jgi:ABC-type Mn2+/Zn2+ transport system permease subunit
LGLSIVVLGLIVFYYKEFLVISFDPVLASTLRIRTTFFKNLQMVILAVTIVVALQTVGVGLVSAMLVTPAATAYLLSRRLPSMMFISAGIGALSSILGLYISYYTNISSGAAIVLTATLFFFLAFLFSPVRGVIGRKPAILAKSEA